MEVLTTKCLGPLVVLGSGLAAVSLVSTLRSKGSDAPIVVVGQESELPYDRPPLSKNFQRDRNTEAVRLDLTAATNIEWMLGARAVGLNLRDRMVSLSDGTTLRWGALVFATGASPRTLPVLENAPFPVLALRTLDDARRIRERLVDGASVAVVGGGVIGLEIAAVAKEAGAHPTVLESSSRLMGRCTPITLSTFIGSQHADHGIDVRLECNVTGTERNGLIVNSSSFLRADLAIVGIGVRANDELARAAGIAADDGIFVDGYGRTTCPGVWAIGDVTRQLHPQSGHFERIETWSNAVGQATAVAAAMLEPGSPPYAGVPWYWTEQFGFRFQVAGLVAGDREEVHGGPGSGKFSIIQMKNGRVVGAACANQPREFAKLKQKIQLGEGL